MWEKERKLSMFCYPKFHILFLTFHPWQKRLDSHGNRPHN